MQEIWTPCRVRNYLQQMGYPLPDDVFATKNFLWKELLVDQSEVPPDSVLINLLKTAMLLQKYRDEIFKSPITITSGWRSPSAHQAIYAKINAQRKVQKLKPLVIPEKSYHLSGMALDFTVAGKSPAQVQKSLDNVHIGGLEYAPTWTHIDIRKNIARFDLKGKSYKIGEFFNAK